MYNFKERQVYAVRIRYIQEIDLWDNLPLMKGCYMNTDDNIPEPFTKLVKLMITGARGTMQEAMKNGGIIIYFRWYKPGYIYYDGWDRITVNPYGVIFLEPERVLTYRGEEYV